MALGPGSEIAGRYRLTAPLGEGGMGAVWRADHLTLGSPVAIKLIDPSLVDSAEALARFMREAQAAAALRSPHVVQIFDYGVEDGVPYIAMEVLEGEDLGSRLERVGTLSPEATARVLTHVARAISKAHELGIVHRDLKPDNIFIVSNEDEEIAKVLDFGVAKATDVGLGTGSDATTRTGAVIGTPQYMSPEQARGDRQVDWRSDLWALAVIAYECLVGYRPFEAEGVGTLLVKICSDPIPVPSSVAPVPAGFDEWFARAAQREPEARFQSAREMMDALRDLLIGSGASGPDWAPASSIAGGRIDGAGTSRAAGPRSSATTTGIAATELGPRSTKRKHSGALAIAAVVLAGGAGAAVWLAGGTDRAPEISEAPSLASVGAPAVSAGPVDTSEDEPSIAPEIDEEVEAAPPSAEGTEKKEAMESPASGVDEAAPAAARRPPTPRIRPRPALRAAQAPHPAAPSPAPAPAPKPVRDIGF